jgi:hypothetical protein
MRHRETFVLDERSFVPNTLCELNGDKCGENENMSCPGLIVRAHVSGHVCVIEGDGGQRAQDLIRSCALIMIMTFHERS